MSPSHEALILIQKMVKVPPEKAFSFFISSTHQGLQHTSQSVWFILNHLLSSGMQTKAQSVLVRIISGQISSSMFSPSSLIQELTQTHFTSSSTCPLLYEAIVNAYVHSQSPDQSLYFLHQMIQKGHAPISNTFNNLLNLLIRSNCFDKAWLVFNKLKDKVALDVYSFGIMIKGCCEDGDLMKSFQLLAMMEETGYSKVGNLAEALNLVKEMEERHIAPTKVTYTILLDRFVRINNMDKAFEIHSLMEKSGLVSDVYTYGVLIHGLCMNGSMKEASKLFKSLDELHLEPNSVIYDTMIHGYCKEGSSYRALRLLNEMIGKGMVPNVASFCSTIGLLCKDEKLKEAEFVLQQMVNLGLNPSVSLYNMVHNDKSEVLSGVDIESVLFQRCWSETINIMGDSACLMQPFCYASGISNDSIENTNHALGQSVSFGRFMTESLAWEKWSSFSHNRYVEEAERFSKPGSVAQKKAFFEAHYKKLAAQKAAAAALLEQQNNAAAQNNVIDNNENNDSQKSSKYEVVVKEKQVDAKVLSHDLDSNVETCIASESEGNKLEECEVQMEQDVVLRNSMMVELEKRLENVDTLQEQSEKLDATPPTPTMTPIMKQVSSYDQEVLASNSKKKPPVSSFKLLKSNGTSKFTTTTPVKSNAPISSKIDNFATPMSNKKSTRVDSTPATLSNADKKRPTPKKVNFTPIREFNRFTASVMKRFESTRVGASSSKASKDSLTPLKTPTMASKEMQKHSSLTPLTETKRNKTPIDSSASRNHTAGPKWRLLSGENKLRSPIISSPFSLRTEERAKLEEKFNANEVQKVQLHTKLKEKAGTEIRKLRQSFCFQARPLPDFYKERKASNIETRKVPQTRYESPNARRYPILNMSECKTSLPPNRPSLKNNGTKNFLGKTGPILTHHHPLTSNSSMKIITTHENASPNIQHKNQYGRITNKDYADSRKIL
ncbi:pentatricopeptide repeat-containing protein [Trifolium repens]|nr:pentatricopeptide repeat-containing protein [Trifolium repens]KAK2420389.1 pentatricopeptide repeat-containing protein [Trifolium repens]KAK2420405.1 pentatricopeptide repeat-containing protein [Trifolium repens]KAK2420413.1 pentatricopeptide repeat-containing protein [Trifolium repens]